MESGPQGCPHLAKISSKEMKFPSGPSVLCPAGSEVPCLPEPPSWGRLGAAVLAVCPRQEEFLELAPVWLHLGLGLTDLLGAVVFLQKDSQEKELCALPSP